MFSDLVVSKAILPFYRTSVHHFTTGCILLKFSVIVFRAFLTIFRLKFDLCELKFYDRILCSERRKCHFRGSNFKNFPGENTPGPPKHMEALQYATVRFLPRSAPELSCWSERVLNDRN